MDNQIIAIVAVLGGAILYWALTRKSEARRRNEATIRQIAEREKAEKLRLEEEQAQEELRVEVERQHNIKNAPTPIRHQDIVRTYPEQVVLPRARKTNPTTGRPPVRNLFLGKRAGNPSKARRYNTDDDAVYVAGISTANQFDDDQRRDDACKTDDVSFNDSSSSDCGSSSTD